MLYVRRIVVNRFADAFHHLLGDMFASCLKMAYDIVYPVTSWYFLQPHQVAKLIERHAAIEEDRAHHVSLTAIKAIRCVMVVLPDRTQPALYFLGIVKLSYLLKFVNADYDMPVFRRIRIFPWLTSTDPHDCISKSKTSHPYILQTL